MYWYQENGAMSFISTCRQAAIPLPNPVVEKRRVAETYDYASSGIDYNKGTDHHVSGSHYVKCTDEEFAKWCK